MPPNGLQVHPEGKYVVDIDKTIDITKLKPNDRVALKNDSYVLHLVLPLAGRAFAAAAACPLHWLWVAPYPRGVAELDFLPDARMLTQGRPESLDCAA